MRALFRGSSSVFGHHTTRVAKVAVALGVTGFVAGIAWGHARIALGALAASWLYCAGLAAGGVAFSAAVRLSQGRWASGVTPLAEATGGFFAPAMALLALLVLAAPVWIPVAGHESWKNWLARAVRDLAATAVLFALARHYVARARAGATTRGLAVAYLLSYAATLSLWAIDLVMGLTDWTPSTVISPFYFVGAFLAGIAFAALLSVLRPSPAHNPSSRHDLGKLLFAFVVFWGYLTWAAYLPVWYGNLPKETGQLLALWAGGWKVLSASVMIAVLGFPFFFFIPERNKRGRATLAVGAASILAGLLGERFLLVLPSLPQVEGSAAVVICVCVTLGVLGLFLLTVGAELALEAGGG